VRRTVGTERFVGFRHQRPLPQEVIQAGPVTPQGVIGGHEPTSRKQEIEGAKQEADSRIALAIMRN